MSQQRRKTEPGRMRAPLGQAAGDSGVAGQTKQNHTNRSKSKIPKNLRYDLENALVGLCDVWFEEIKPHLVANNIKVHVPSAVAASGDHQGLPPGCDHRRPPGCSHLDPGAAPDRYQRVTASCADCCSTQRTASKARCRRPPASPRRLSRDCTSHILKDPCRTNDSKPRAPLRPHPQPPQPPRNWRTPRLCRTYSVLAPVAFENQIKKTPNAQLFYNNYPKRARPKTADKSTQTPKLRLPSASKPSRAPVTVTTARQDVGQVKPRVTSPSCLRCPATTTLARRSQQPALPMSPLFKDDLIDMIAEKSDKQLKLLFQSPPREESESTDNLLHAQGPRLHAESKKIRPWR